MLFVQLQASLPNTPTRLSMLQQRFSPFSTFVLLLATEGLVGSWLSLVHTPLSSQFWSWFHSDPKDPTYKAVSSSFALERDALDHLYPEIAESPELCFEYEIEEAVFSSNPFSDLGLSPE